MFISRKKLEKLEEYILESRHMAAQAMSSAEGAHARLDGYDKNGMATIVNKLQEEVLLTKKDAEDGDLFAMPGMLYAMTGVKTPKEPTLRGKVEAIVKHLGLDFTVTEKKVEPSEVVVVKNKVTKKKGRR